MGRRKAEAADAAFVAQRLTHCLAECQRHILDGVVLVDLEVALAFELQGKAAVPGYLVEHVVVEADAGTDGDGV